MEPIKGYYLVDNKILYVGDTEALRQVFKKSLPTWFFDFYHFGRSFGICFNHRARHSSIIIQNETVMSEKGVCGLKGVETISEPAAVSISVAGHLPPSLCL
jgi:hypothetical protein